jgi:hypothetical protein
MARFGTTEYEDYEEWLAKLSLSGSLQKDQLEFECLANQVSRLTKSFLAK